MSIWGIPDTPEFMRRRDTAVEDLRAMADSGGIACYHCGRMIHGRDAIGALSYMAPPGSDANSPAWQASAYCRDCADAL